MYIWRDWFSVNRCSSKEHTRAFTGARRCRFLSGGLNRHQFVAEQTGLPLDLLLKPLLSVFVPRRPDAVVVFDLFGNESVEDDGDLVCGGRYPGRWAKLGFHPA